MRALCGCFCSVQAIKACQDLPVLSAWLQRMLSTSSLQTGTNTSSKAKYGSLTRPADNEQQGGTNQQQDRSSVVDNQWRHAKQQRFSIRPSVLSPLHALHREGEEVEKRLAFLTTTLKAHLKLSDAIHPDELKTHASSSDPVAAALAARRQQLAAAKDSYERLLKDHLTPCSDRAHMDGYYTLLELSVQQKDKDAAELQKVLEGDRTVWDYWFNHFTPQYAGLPSLGSIEKTYNQADDEELLQRLAQQRVATDKAPAEPKVDRWGRAKAVGSRKTSTAQVFLWRGSGRVLVNRKPLDAYFPDLLLRSAALRPLSVTGLMGQLDILVKVEGGGVSGQAQAAAHGIAKALRRLDPSLKSALKAAGLLKRDPRMVERKKPGKAKARKSFAWVKR